MGKQEKVARRNEGFGWKRGTDIFCSFCLSFIWILISRQENRLKKQKKKNYFLTRRRAGSRNIPNDSLALGMGVEEWDWRQFPSFMLACYRDAGTQGLPPDSAAHSPLSLWIFAPNNSRSAAKAGAFFSPQFCGLFWKHQLCPGPQ